MSTALLSIVLMRFLTARRPDLRDAQRADLVTRLIRLGPDHVGIDGGRGDVRVSPDAEALIGSPAKPQTTQPTTTDRAPDTTGPFFAPVFAAVEASYPELTSIERVKLASEIVSTGGVGFAADKSLVFLESARTLAPKLPYSTNPERDARARAYEAARSETPSPTASASTPPTPSAKPTDLATQLAAVPGTDERSKAKRAAIRAAHLRASAPSIAAIADRNLENP